MCFIAGKGKARVSNLLITIVFSTTLLGNIVFQYLSEEDGEVEVEEKIFRYLVRTYLHLPLTRVTFLFLLKLQFS